MVFKEFEGFKRLKNEKKLDIDSVYLLLEKYQNDMGKMKFETEGENKVIIIDVDGKYNAKIRLSPESIVIERVLEDGATPAEEPTPEKGKELDMAKADRMIDQIYDLLNDYMDDEKITEHITSSKITLRMKESEEKGIFSRGSTFEIRDNKNKLLYEVYHKKLNRLFSIKSLECHMEVTSMNYANMHLDIFEIQEKPFNVTKLKKDAKSTKLKFISEGIGKKITITADYTDNHYLIELSGVVIGAVDCLDPLTKKDYSIEVNNLREMNFVVTAAVLIDTYLRHDLK